MEHETRMHREVLEIPDAVARLLQEESAGIAAAAQALRDLSPAFLISVARGSSDHVATYLKYASELMLGLPMASVGPSVASIYHAPLQLRGAACIAISQSGQSPDIVDMASAARKSGALSLAITNDPGAPLARASDRVLDIRAGAERSVAATKTVVNSAVAGLLLLAEWKGDADLKRAIFALPEALARATALEWPAFREALAGHSSLFTLGRGPGFAISNEAALKFKETCQIHAESYSSAEVMHGPVSIIERGFPTLIMAADDAAKPGLIEVAEKIGASGAQVFITASGAGGAGCLEVVRTGHPLCDPLAILVTFYGVVERIARERGLDPDRPPHLKKVTQTL